MIDWIAGLVAQISAAVGDEASRYATSEGRAMIALVFDVAVKGLLIVSAAGLAAYLLRGASSAVRHFVWTLAAAALVALPVFALAMPRWQVAVPGVGRLMSPDAASDRVSLREVRVPENRRIIVVPGHEAGSTVIIGERDIVVEVPRIVIERPVAPLPPIPPVPPVAPMPPMPPIAPTPPTPPGRVRVRPDHPMAAPDSWFFPSDAWFFPSDGARRAREQAAEAAAAAREAAREAQEASREVAWEARQAAREAAWEARALASDAAWEARAVARQAALEARRATREAAVRARARRRLASPHDDSATAALVTEARTAPSSPALAPDVSPTRPGADGALRRSGLASFPVGSLVDGVPWSWLLVATWLTGVVVVLSRVVVGATRVHMLGRRAWCIERGWPVPLLRRLCADLGIARRVKLLEGESTAMPLTWGVLNPVVLLPSSAAEWPAGRLETVLRHELAHVRRLDVLTQLIAELACALHWFNPLVWLVAKRLRVEREMACDDDVLTSGSSPSDYAADLVALARSLHPAPAAYAAIAMARPAYLQDRVHALLDDDRRRGRVRMAPALATSGVALLVVAPLAALVPVPDDGVREPMLETRAPASEDRIEFAPMAEPNVTIRSPEPEIDVDVIEPEIVIPPLPSIRPPVIDALSISRRLREKIAVLSIGTRRDDAPQETICWGRDDDTRRTSVSRNDESYSLDWEGDGCEVQIRIRGEVRFNADFTAIEWIAPGGSMRLVEEAGSTERRLDIGPGPEGLEYTWRVDGRETPFDAAASDWLNEMLLQLFRSAGYAANERSLWFLREHGVPGLLQEIDQLRSDHTRRAYYQVALERGNVDATTAAQLTERAAAQIRSDHELSRLLLAAGKRFDFNDALRDAFLAASRTLESDHERRRVLTTVLARGSLDAVTTAALLASVAEMGSDHEKAQVLTSLGAQYALDPGIRADYLSAAATIGSDHDKRRVLDALIAQGSLSADDLAALLDVASTIRSDHEASRILVAVASADLAAPALRRAFLTAAATIDSDHDHRRALTHVLNTGRLTPDVLSMVLHSALEIDSDHEAAEVLLLVLSTQQLDADRRTEFLRALDTIESEHNHGRVASALLRTAEGG